jgi:two-component system, NtrC family, response regulator AtoC
LRERREEIPGLTDLFINRYSVQYNRPLIEITPPTLQALVNHDWPGNVRELENLAKRVVVLGTESTVLKDLQQAAVAARHRPVTPSSVPPEPAIAVPAPVREASHSPTALVAAAAGPTLPSPMPPIEPGQYSLKDVSRHAAREAERALILRMLQHTRWNRKEAAEILGISYKALLYKIKENGLDRAS